MEKLPDKGGEKRGDPVIRKAMLCQVFDIDLDNISFNSHRNPVEWLFPNLSAYKSHLAFLLQIQRCEPHP